MNPAPRSPEARSDDARPHFYSRMALWFCDWSSVGADILLWLDTVCLEKSPVMMPNETNDQAGGERREEETPTEYNECLYCGEPVEAPAQYCCEEHEEHRSIR
jgi:hypothetical protein